MNSTGDVLEKQLNLIEKSEILLLIKHQENQNMLKKYLEDQYQVITSSSFNLDQGVADIIIVDEKGLKEKKEKLLAIKNSKTSLYLPVILISRTSLENIPKKYLEIIDEIIQIPIAKRILKSRIKNLLNIRKLFLSTQIYQKLTEKNPVGICILQANNIKYVNNAFLDIVETDNKNMLDQNITDLFSSDKIKSYLEQESISQEKKLTLQLNKTSKKWVNIRFSEIKYENIKLKLVIVVDITEQKQSEEKIKYLSFHDQLTDLYNRDYFMEELKRLDTKRQLPLTLIMGDINSLKLINDAFGHDKGDFLIKKIAEILEKNLREEDILARIGGDEFAILLPKTTKKMGKEIMERIKKKSKNTDIKPLHASIALGVATKRNKEENIKDILKKADDKMYENKTETSKEIKNKVIVSMKNYLQKNTTESSDHIKTSHKLALDLADKLNLNQEQKNKLKLLIQLHDIGKVSISKEVLQKSETLTEKELDKVKNHTECGYRIAKAVPRLAPITEEILTHHERWDGKGYPQGLQKDEIPLLARIVAIIEAYEKMTRGQSHQNSKNKQEALAEIKNQAGTKFDPELVEKFMEMMKNND